ncbi:hypothetical protein GGX14DRAFT_555967 [Mycena pura]|uniref:Uncharacterized protein n=1 Tax=Mycena pura TaxID=153505 RepID=A0AAD7E467_9AGAR|nr:hypothetical protein GGX14DRAFT_555967 [Mycena pura]
MSCSSHSFSCACLTVAYATPRLTLLGAGPATTSCALCDSTSTSRSHTGRTQLAFRMNGIVLISGHWQPRYYRAAVVRAAYIDDFFVALCKLASGCLVIATYSSLACLATDQSILDVTVKPQGSKLQSYQDVIGLNARLLKLQDLIKTPSASVRDCLISILHKTSRPQDAFLKTLESLNSSFDTNGRASIDERRKAYSEERAMQPSAKALGKRKVVADPLDHGRNETLFAAMIDAHVLFTESGDEMSMGPKDSLDDRLTDSEDDEDSPLGFRHRSVQHYVYDAVVERMQQRLRDGHQLLVNGVH